MRIEDAGGKRIAEAEQKSMLVEPLTLEQWEALAESAAYKMVEPLRGMLRHAAPAQAPAADSARGLDAMAARSGQP
jgi:hypothetical protein